MVISTASNGSLTAALQLGLSRSGYYSGKLDGIYGEKTKNAVINFQRAFSLTPDGIAGSETLKYVERYIKGYFIKTVAKGETLWSIAALFGSSVNALITANPGIKPDNISIGDKLTVPFGYPVVPTEIPYSHYLTTLLLDGIVSRYPFIKKSEIGKSVSGKNIEALTVGNGNKHIFINSGFHANEWLNIPVVLRFTEEYSYAVANYDYIEDKNASELFSNTLLHIVPLVNPDGTDLVTGALYEGNYYNQAKSIASHYPQISFPSGWKANINGVDLNLQFPAAWDEAKRIKYEEGFTKPSPIEFVGSAPLSEPESEIIYQYTKDNEFDIILAYHSQGSIIYWKYRDYLPEKSEEIGNSLSKASGYPLELTPYNSSFAGYKDWFIQDYNKPGYTIETGRGTNPLPISQIDEIYPANKKLIVQALEETMKL